MIVCFKEFMQVAEKSDRTKPPVDRGY